MEDLLNVLAIEDLEIAENNYNKQQTNNNRTLHDPFIELDDKKFLNIFRLSKNSFKYLIQLLEPHLRPQIRKSDLSVQTRVLTALRFYGAGSYQTDVGLNKSIDVSQPSVSRAVAEVTAALNQPQIFDEWVCFPNSFIKLNKLREEFYRLHGFPGVVGCIDCTHVALVPPNIEDPEYPEHIYVNRKHYHSINVQLICDANLKILNVNAKYPGSTNDAYIWRRSNVQSMMRSLHAAGHKDYFLLGDSGYPLRSWLLTPIDAVEPNTPEAHYNYTHKHTRVKIECCNEVLKSRFRCLLKHRVLHSKPATVCTIINACVVLHNMCREHNIPEADEENKADFDFGIMNEENGAPEDGGVVRAINLE